MIKPAWRAVCLTTAQGAGAQTTDCSALCAEHAHAATTKANGSALLSPPGDVMLPRIQDDDGDHSCVGVDMDEQGAVGCVFRAPADLDAVLRMSPLVAPDALPGIIRPRLEKAARFVSLNGFPARPANDAADLMAQARSGWLACPSEAGTRAFVGGETFDALAQGVASAEADAELDASLAVPRLPVTNPCL